MAEQIPVLLDTDIGSDIDDAVALAYLLREPRCELLGATTVTGDVQKRAALVEIVCDAAGRPHVPIHCGRRNVLVNGPGQPNVPHYAAVEQRHHHLHREESSAVEFLRRTIRSRPGEIVLLTIGPFSNVAALFALDPEIPFLLREVVSMGGSFFEPGRREWNALVDPVATSIVYSTPRKAHRSIGLDVTLQCRMSAAEVRRRFDREPLLTVRAMAETWFESVPEITFHDPLTAALIFHPDICTYRSGRVHVDLSEDAEKGGLTRLEEGEGPDRVADAVSPEAFFDSYFEVFQSR